MNKYVLLFSSVAIVTLSLGEEAPAMVSLPNVGRCFSQASTKTDFKRCEALRDCVENNSDDQASLQGCLGLAEDSYIVEQNIPMFGGVFGMQGSGGAFPTIPVSGFGGILEEEDVETEKANSELVWGIQGDKGFTNQQEGPNINT